MRIGSLLSCVLLVAVGALPALAQDYDLLIADGVVVDGTGNPWYRADVAVTGDRIVAVGVLDRSRARRVIDARGLWVTPGFVDPHSHAAGGLASADLDAQYLFRLGVPMGIYGGTLEVFRNMIAQHALGLGRPAYAPATAGRS